MLVSSSVISAAETPDLIIVNSNDWIDVYNSLLYGSLSNVPILFLSHQSQTSTFFNSIDHSVNSILLVESDSRLSPTASKILSTLDYDITIVEDDDTGLFFASLIDLDSYILVDKDFPLNGLSVAPYAVASNSWVFFIDTNFNSEIISLLSGKEILSYGRIPQQLLQKVTPSVVIDKGNKYRNSVEISKLFVDKYPTKQYVLTDGSFLEEEFFIGKFPVLVVGVSTTPKPIEDFFAETTVASAVVVGQASIPPSMSLKKLLESKYDRELKLVAKLGKTSPDLSQENLIIPLNMFPIPSPEIVLSVESFFYNQITRQIEVQFTNAGDIFLSYVPSIVLTIDGVTSVIESASEHYFLEKSESRTVQFSVDLNSLDSISAELTVVYGESQDSFDFSLSESYSPLNFVSIVDDSDVLVEKILYDSKNKVFLISVVNNGSVSAYIDMDLNNIFVSGVGNSFSTPRSILVEPGKNAVLVIYAVLSDIDLLSNPTISYTSFFGQRNFALIKSISGVVSLGKHSFFDSLIANSGVLILVISLMVFGLLLFFLLRKKQKYICLHCGAIHRTKPSRCRSCGFGRFKKQ